MQVYVGLILGLGLCWGRFSDKDSTSRRQLRMQQIWFKNVKKWPKMCKRPETTFVSNPVNIANLATSKVGFGFVRSTSTSTRKFEICHCSTGIFL
jgi:hypothetical protein